MTAKRQTAKKKQAKTSPDGKPGEVRDFDPRRISDSVTSYVDVVMTYPDGTKESVMVPKYPDDTVEGMNERAAEYARALRRVKSAWNSDLTPGQIAERLDVLVKTTALQVVQNLLAIAEDRFGNEALASIFGAGTDFEIEAAIDRAIEKQAAFLSSRLEKGDAEKIIYGLEREIVAGILLDFEHEQGDALADLDEAEYDRRFSEAFDAHYSDHGSAVVHLAAQDIARARLESLKASEATLDQIVELLNPTPDTVLNLGTHPIGREMQRGLIRPTLDPHDTPVKVREGGSAKLLKVRTSVSLDNLAGTNARFELQEDVLENIQRNLLEVKKHGAALLKLHLDLTSRAYEAGGELPVFRYSFADALDRLGYVKNTDRRAYHRDAMQALRKRLATLTGHYVAAWETSRNGKEYLVDTPYWIVQGLERSKQESLGLLPNLLNEENAVAYHYAYIQPGLWWPATRMSHYRIEVPRALLRLPTDGNGNERERMALLLATYLAVHVRVNQRHHAGERVPITAGKLLEKSGITSWSEFSTQHGTVASRQRDYLEHTSTGTGALQILRDLRAFDVNIRDEDDFFSSGRGWRERFWNAMLEVEVPDLGIAALRKA